MLKASGGWIFVMVVVPAFAYRQQCHQPIVAAMLFSLVVLIAKHVAQRIDRPRDMPNSDDANVDSPDDHAHAKLQGAGLPPANPTDDVAQDKEYWDLSQGDQQMT